MSPRETRKSFQEGLPRKRISAGCLLFDEAGRLLIVKPTYKDGWEIPGGTVNANESPLQGCIREIHEELAIDWQPQGLLTVDYTGETAQRTESLNFIFYGGVLPLEVIKRIQLPPQELSEHQLLVPAEAMQLMRRRLHRRVERCLNRLGVPGALYLEEQKMPWPTR